MGKTRHPSEQEEKMHRIAEDILMSLGFIDCCEIHEDFHYCPGPMNEPRIYAAATKKLQEIYPELTDFKEFHEQIRRILQETVATGVEQCPYCEKIRKE